MIRNNHDCTFVLNHKVTDKGLISFYCALDLKVCFQKKLSKLKMYIYVIVIIKKSLCMCLCLCVCSCVQLSYPRKKSKNVYLHSWTHVSSICFETLNRPPVWSPDFSAVQGPNTRLVSVRSPSHIRPQLPRATRTQPSRKCSSVLRSLMKFRGFICRSLRMHLWSKNIFILCI